MITGGQHAFFWTTRNHFLLTTFAALSAKITVVENGCDERSLTHCALPPARRRHRRVGALTAKAQPNLRDESAVDGPGPTGVVYALNAGLLWLWSRFGAE
jgi:hypothetical protein